MRFKINGERNSGTNFLKKLLETNFGRAFDQKVVQEKKYYWKHGVPDQAIKTLYPGIIDVFVIRNLNEWLVSMFQNPYHLKKHSEFDKFLNIKQTSIESKFVDAKTNEIINLDDNDKTIFEIRYYKIEKILEYFKNQDNVMIVNLSLLQDEKICNFLLEKMKEIFFLKPKVAPFEVTFPHTKLKKVKIKNRNYNVKIEDFMSIIDKHKNREIEEQIDNICLMKYRNKIYNIDIKNIK